MDKNDLLLVSIIYSMTKLHVYQKISLNALIDLFALSEKLSKEDREFYWKSYQHQFQATLEGMRPMMENLFDSLFGEPVPSQGETIDEAREKRRGEISKILAQVDSKN